MFKNYRNKLFSYFWSQGSTEVVAQTTLETSWQWWPGCGTLSGTAPVFLRPYQPHDSGIIPSSRCFTIFFSERVRWLILFGLLVRKNTLAVRNIGSVAKNCFKSLCRKVQKSLFPYCDQSRSCVPKVIRILYKAENMAESFDDQVIANWRVSIFWYANGHN